MPAAGGNQIQFGVGFNVDKTSLQSLQKDLMALSKMTTKEYLDIHKGMNAKEAEKELLQLRKNVTELSNTLNSAFNKDLGALNIAKLNQSLDAKAINTYAQSLSKMGAQGQQAFTKFSSEILTSNRMLKESNNTLDKMGQTLTNSIKWTISSSLINNFTGSIQKAYGYVKQLDEDLNNIRIVTGQSAEQMEIFAKKANDAAQALGSTTTAYAEAALIYYQQGLGDDAVIERTNTTIKMANVLGESADRVSSYMTAIWNNFDDGSQSLEHYGDVITALGATTASSSEEIASGVEKFASVAETAGLSYEYATSALATVVATTRQSADTVGTSLKTIFSRIQGLKLGETLEDGTDLNKYSEALMKVGINIKDQQGELKNMDDILDEMGAKWQTLSKDQQIALAQAVAGTRQYNQMLALMDNWDFMTKNIETASKATGTLNKQQDIYMDSMEAHLKSLKSAQQNLYDSMFDSDSFKSLIDVFTGLTNGMAGFIDSIGGGGNALLALGGIATNVFSKQITGGIATAMINSANAKYNVQQYNAELAMANNLEQAGINSQMVDLEKLAGYKKGILEVDKFLTEEQRNQFNEELKEISLLQQENKEWQIKAEEAKKYFNSFNENNLKDINFLDADEDKTAATDKLEKQLTMYERIGNAINKNTEEVKAFTDQNGQIKSGKLDELTSKFEVVSAAIRNSKNITEEERQELAKMADAYKQALESGDPNKIIVANGNLQASLERLKDKTIDFKENITKMAGEASSSMTNLNTATARLEEELERLRQLSTVDNLVKGLGGLAQALSGLRSLWNLPNIWQNQDLSMGEKIVQTVSALSMGISMLAIGLPKVNAMMLILSERITKVDLATMALTLKNKLASFSFKNLKDSLLKTSTAAKAGTSSLVEVGEAGVVSGTSTAAAWATVLIPLAAAAAALFALYKTIKLIVDIVNLQNKKIEEAKASYESLTITYENLKNANKEFTDSFNAYDKAADKLNSLTKGTQEYSEALKEANEAAMNLIKSSNGALKAGEDYNWVNGQIIFTENSIDKYQNELNRKEENALAASFYAKSQITAAERAKQNLGVRDTNSYIQSQGGPSLSFVGDAVDVMGKTMMAISAGSHSKDLGEQMAASMLMPSWLQKIIADPIAKAYKDVATGAANYENAILDALGDQDVSVLDSDAFWENLENIEKPTDEVIESFKQLAETTQQLKQEENAYYQMLTQQAFNQKGVYKDNDKDYNDTVDIIGATIAKKIQEENTEKYEKEIKDENKDVIKEYFDEAQIEDFVEIKKITSEGNVVYLSTDGEKTVKKDDIVSTLSARDTREYLENDLARIIDGYINNIVGNRDSSFIQLLYGKTDNIGVGELNNWANEDEAAIKQQLKDYGITEEELKNIGLTFDDVIKNISDSMKKFKTDGTTIKPEDLIPKDLPIAARKAFADLFTDGIENEDIKNQLTPHIVSMMSSALEFTGYDFEKSGELKKIFSKIINNGQIKEFQNTIDSLDWNTTDLAGFKKALDEANLNLGLTDEQLEIFCNAIKKTAKTSEDAAKQMSNTLSLAKSIKDGGTIKEEEFNSLDVNYQKFFRRLLDGSYELIGSAEQFKNAVFKQEAEQIKQQQNNKNNFEEQFKGQTWEKIWDGIDTLIEDEILDEIDISQGPMPKTPVQVAATGNILSDSNTISPYANIVYDDSGKAFRYDKDQLDKQLGLLEKIATANSDEELTKQIEDWKNNLEKNTIEYQDIKDISGMLSARAKEIKNTTMDTAEAAAAYQELLSQATSLSELTMAHDSLLEYDKDGKATSNDALELAYDRNAARLRQEEMDSDVKAAEVDVLTDQLIQLAGVEGGAKLGMEELGKATDTSAKSFKAIAKDILRASKGMETLKKNYDTWSKTLAKANATVDKDWLQNMADAKDAISEIIGMSKDDISNKVVLDLFQKNPNDLKKMMEGGEGAVDAINRAQRAVIDDIFSDPKYKLKGKGKSIFGTIFDDAGLDNEKLDKLKDKFTTIGEAMSALKENADFKVGIEMDDEKPIIKAIQKIIDQFHLGVNEAKLLGDAMNMDLDITEVEDKSVSEQPVIATRHTRTEEKEEKTEDGKITTWMTYEEPVEVDNKKFPSLYRTIAIGTKGRKAKINSGSYKGNKSSASPGNTGGGKKGGSTSKKSSPKTRQKDPYKKVNTQLDNTSKALDKINKKQELQLETSDKYLQSLRDQNTQYNKQIALAKEKINIAKRELEVGRKDNKVYSLAKDYGAKENIKKLAKKLGIKVKNSDFDEYGNLLTSEDVLQKGFEKTKKLDDESKKKKIYDALQTEITRASTAASEKTSAEDAKREAQLLLQQNKANALTIRFQSKIDEQSFTREWNDFKKTTIKRLREDNPLDLSEIISIDRDNLNSRFEDIKTATDRVNSLLSINKNDKKSNYWVKGQGFNEAQYAEDLEAAYEELKTAMTDAEDLQKTIIEASITARENLNEGYNNLYSAYDKLNEYYEHQKTMTTLLYGDKAYGRMTKYYASLTANEWKRTADMYKQVKESIKAFNDYNTEENIKNNDKMLAHTKQTMLDNISAFEGQLQTLVETIKSEFENSVNNIVQTALDGFAHLGGNATFDRLKRNWEIASDTAEKYLDEKNREFAMKDLSFAFDDAIKNADTLHAQQRLTDLMSEQLSIAEQKDKLAQEEVDTIQKMLDLEIKRIALEEAQENKTNMRLRRDANGNYSYQFVANENEVNKAQEEYNKANNELYNDLKDKMNTFGNSFADNYQEYIDEIASILADDSLDENAKRNELEGVKNMFESRLQIDGDNFKSYVDRMRKYLEEEGMSQSEIDEYFEKNFPNFKSMMNIINTGVNLDDTIDKAKEIIAKYYQQLGLLQNKYTEDEFQEALKNNLSYESQMLGLLKEEVKSVDNIALLVKAILEGKTWEDAKTGAKKTFEELKDLKSLDTGGYTGAWGVDGRVALLHEKELVLNQQDTSNILAAVSVVRNIGSGAFDGIANTIRSVKASVFGADDKNLQQSVQITAEFPNVSNSAEIENALNSLVNKASQFAWSDDLKI